MAGAPKTMPNHATLYEDKVYKDKADIEQILTDTLDQDFPLSVQVNLSGGVDMRIYGQLKESAVDDKDFDLVSEEKSIIVSFRLIDIRQMIFCANTRGYPGIFLSPQ